MIPAVLLLSLLLAAPVTTVTEDGAAGDATASLSERAVGPGGRTGGNVHACARVAGLSGPLQVAESLRELPASERRRRLIEALRSELLERSGAGRSLLRERRAEAITLLWSAGVVCADAPESVWEEVAALPGIAEVFLDPPRAGAEIDDAGGPNAAVPPEPPLVSLRVPELWARGYTGAGVVVGHIDTGIDFNHPDLADHIWVNEDEIAANAIDDDGNGFVDDVNGWNFSSGNNDPTDLAGHGTHTAGLLAGDGTSGTQTGAAPDALLMVIRRGSTQSALWQSSQYAIENGAQVIAQAVSWKWSFIPPPDYPSWRRQAEAELAAGIVHVNSAGNTGLDVSTEPVPYGVAAPANCPPPWLHPSLPVKAGVSSVIGVGNVDSRSLVIDPDSAYGPSEWTDIQANVDVTYPHSMPADLQDYPHYEGSGGLLKPDVAAPGESSSTTELGGGYVTFGGTSAAQPRVAGILALLLQAVPDATPAELAEALLSTAIDEGAAGFDDRYGAGIPDALAALEALGPTIRVQSASIIDGGAPHGDGDGDADEGEIDRLSATIENASASALTGVDLILTAVSGATVHDGYQRIASLPGSGTATTAAPHFSVEFDAGSCGGTAELRLEIRQGGARRVVPVFVTVGTETETTLIDTDFEAGAGFSVSGSPADGAWVRAIPVGTVSGGQQVAPGADSTPGTGQTAWITGNGSTDPNADDVDGGTTVLTSPSSLAASHDAVELTYHRWFYGSDGAGEDRLHVEATGDGAAWTTIEEVTAIDNMWRERSIVLSDLLTPGAQTRIRFTADDAVLDDTVEGGLDDLTLTGIDVACSVFAITPNAASPVGDTLTVEKAAGGHLKISWTAPSATGGTDPVLGYSALDSLAAPGPFSEIGTPLDTSFIVVDGQALDGQTIRFFEIESM
ncbi:MAG: S8 family serine peptidase [Acidobacteriota bacterium]|nr:S8 family serine peptidase [Acidobacteriota bacterium]